MAITSLAQIISGLQASALFVKGSSTATGIHSSLWGRPGMPIAGLYDTTLNGVVLTAPVTGQIPWNDPVSGLAYLARLQGRVSRNVIANASASLIVCDRLWHNGGFDVTSTSAQNITSPTWPARDELGGTAGQGVYLALEISAVAGAATPTITVAYTDSDNNAQESTNIIAVSTSAISSFYYIALAAGSRGVKSVQSLTLSTSWISGTINLVAFRPIVILETSQYYQSVAIDAVTAAMPMFYAGSVLFLVILPELISSSLTIVSGKIEFTWG